MGNKPAKPLQKAGKQDVAFQIEAARIAAEAHLAAAQITARGQRRAALPGAIATFAAAILTGIVAWNTTTPREASVNTVRSNPPYQTGSWSTTTPT